MYEIEICYGSSKIVYNSEMSGLEIADAISKSKSKFWNIVDSENGETMSIFIDSIRHIKSKEVK